MAKFILVTPTLISQISDAYKIIILKISPIEAGETNSSFLIESDQGKYIFTVYETKSFTDTELLAKTLNYLKENNFNTTVVKPLVNGQLVFKIANKAGLLKKWIPGNNLRVTKEKDYLNIGKSIASLHLITVPEFLPKIHSYGLQEMPKSLGINIDQNYEKWLKNKIKYLLTNLPTNLPKAIIHGDLFDDNIIFNHGKFNSIIDFEDCCHFYRVYDLGSAIFGTCIENEHLNFEKVSQLILGYQKIIILSEEEIANIQFFTVFAGAAISAWHYKAYNIDNPNPKKLNWHQKTMTKTENIFQYSSEKFVELIK